MPVHQPPYQSQSSTRRSPRLRLVFWLLGLQILGRVVTFLIVVPTGHLTLVLRRPIRITISTAAVRDVEGIDPGSRGGAFLAPLFSAVFSVAVSMILLLFLPGLVSLSRRRLRGGWFCFLRPRLRLFNSRYFPRSGLSLFRLRPIASEVVLIGIPGVCMRPENRLDFGILCLFN